MGSAAEPRKRDAERPRQDRRRTAAARYVAELSRDLASIARHHGLDTLGYILEMAQLEAENATRHVDGQP